MLKRINEEFDVKVSIEDAVQIIGISAWIGYDPSIIEVVDGSPETAGTQVIAQDLGFLSSAQLLVGIQKDQNNVEQPGTLVCGYVSIPPIPVDGSGDVFSVKFRAIASGNTDIYFIPGHIKLEDINGDVTVKHVGDIVEIPVTATIRITVL
jgi:hypothetical protein